MDANSETSGIQLATYRNGPNGSGGPEEADSPQQPHHHHDPGRRRAYGTAGHHSMYDDTEKKDYLSDGAEDSLPSIRAEIATTLRYRDARGRTRDGQKESTPLLADSGLHETESGDEDDEFRTLGSSSKRQRWIMW